MSLQGENVVPGKHGKSFTVNIEKDEDFEAIKKDLVKKVDGIKDVLWDNSDYPRELIVHTKTLVPIKEIQDIVKEHGFHAVPKTLFGLEE